LEGLLADYARKLPQIGREHHKSFTFLWQLFIRNSGFFIDKSYTKGGR